MHNTKHFMTHQEQLFKSLEVHEIKKISREKGNEPRKSTRGSRLHETEFLTGEFLLTRRSQARRSTDRKFFIIGREQPHEHPL
jgi:hypothetical protein